MHKTSIIILTYNQLNFTKQCIESIRTYTKKDTYEIIIVENHSTDGTVEWLKDQKDLKVIFNNENVGFPKGCNQGIQIATGNSILLLNNDVIVTKNWLENLQIALYSDESIGAVGPITNSAAYYTAIPTSYQTIDEMHQFAETKNKSDSSLWEERLKLIGYCMLIKQEAIEKIGLLDEQFSPGNFEDDDYSVRLRLNGYKLLLCHDTFIHHYGSVSWRENVEGYSKLLTGNEIKFKNKWNTDSSSYFIHLDIITQIRNELPLDLNKTLNILHIGCQSGGTLLKIKNEYRNANLFGVENNNFSMREASSFASVEKEYHSKNYSMAFFDVIIITEKSLSLDEKLLENLTQKLKSEGLLLLKTPNISNIQFVAQLLNGNNPFLFGNQNYYGISQIQDILSKLHIKYEVQAIKHTQPKDVQEVIQGFQHLFGDRIKHQIETSHYLIKCKLLDHHLLSIIKEVIEDNSSHIEELNKKEIEDIIEAILFLNNPIGIMHKIAIINFTNGNYEMVLPYLQKAYELDPNNSDTIFNIAYVLKSYGDLELANQYIEWVKEKDNELQNLQNDIKIEIEKKNNELVFLLRRFEYDIALEETKQTFISKLSNGIFSEEQILNKIQNSIVDKIKVLHALAICCFEFDMYDFVLPFLNRAYEMDNHNEDTLYNLAFVLISFDEHEIARNYLNKMKNKNEKVLELLHLTEGVTSYE